MNRPTTESQNTNNLQYDYIQKIIQSHPIVLFMKGTAEEPQCGFSFQVVQALKDCGAGFHDENVLAHPKLRADLKEFSDWPTFPQLYVRGQFIGGCDIVSDLHRQHKLQEIVNDQGEGL